VTAVWASVELAVPVDDAWAAVTDWVGQGQWIPFTRVAVTAGDGGEGTRLSARTGVGPLAFVDTMVVDRWDPPRRCEVAHLGRVVRGRGVFTVEPTPAGSRVTWLEQLDGLAARLAAPVSRLALQLALRRLARVAVR